MIKSSSEPALRAGSEGFIFKIFLGGGFREFSILGGFSAINVSIAVVGWQGSFDVDRNANALPRSLPIDAKRFVLTVGKTVQ